MAGVISPEILAIIRATSDESSAKAARNVMTEVREVAATTAEAGQQGLREPQADDDGRTGQVEELGAVVGVYDQQRRRWGTGSRRAAWRDSAMARWASPCLIR